MSNKTVKLTVGALVSAIALILLALPVTRQVCERVTGSGTIRIAATELTRGTAKKFCFRDAAGAKLRFVLARGSDGTLRGVFDACRQCFSFHKGFTLSAGYMVCRLCGNRYKLDHIHEGKASCVPVKLPIVERGNSVEVNESELAGGAWLF